MEKSLQFKWRNLKPDNAGYEIYQCRLQEYYIYIRSYLYRLFYFRWLSCWYIGSRFGLLVSFDQYSIDAHPSQVYRKISKPYTQIPREKLRKPTKLSNWRNSSPCYPWISKHIGGFDKYIWKILNFAIHPCSSSPGEVQMTWGKIMLLCMTYCEMYDDAWRKSSKFHNQQGKWKSKMKEEIISIILSCL